MNIKKAKTEIIRTLKAYHEKDEAGHYLYPLVRQRPILLMGPPGIGKTAIMEQIARECGVGLVSYTITHHTRQSAIGLPHIETRTYDGRQMQVTEYTLSEIIASVYACMERTGSKEGILFIDEINCVSETLAPTMLQFLQNKTFGTHRVPEGWLIVAAGNPREYNKSVREFDIVTLDRVRRIDVEADCAVWMTYAWSQHVHEAILSYLQIRREAFYQVQNEGEHKTFVTARGWEDLSQIIKGYEKLGEPVTEDLVVQYLQKEDVAREFAAYYQIFQKYQTDYAIPGILQGTCAPDAFQMRVQMAQNAAFEERFTVVSLVLAYLDRKFEAACEREASLDDLYKAWKHYLDAGDAARRRQDLDAYSKERRRSLRTRAEADLVTPEEERRQQWVLQKLDEANLALKKEHITDGESERAQIRRLFEREQEALSAQIAALQAELDRAFRFLKDCFQDEQEMLLFVTGLTQNEKAAQFIAAHGCDAYFQYSKRMLHREREKELRDACRDLLSTENES